MEDYGKIREKREIKGAYGRVTGEIRGEYAKIETKFIRGHESGGKQLK